MDRKPGWLYRVRKKECMTHLLTKLRSLKNQYHDDIPKEIVNSTSSQSNYKCRASWWGMLNMNIEVLKRRNLIPPEFITSYEQLFKSYKSHTVNGDGLTKKNDIDSANRLLTDIIENLSSQLS
ncbi:hypothetical protein GOV12_05425 [Candidatus Pacearchaeota archaeon]|nr:hypothetical protein [Candidatus Pacearchaeota archaeon]